MLAHIFRPNNFVLSPVTSVAPNNKKIVVFRRNGMCEFVNSLSLSCFLLFDLKEEVIQSFFLDLNLIICLTASKKILFFDTSNLEIQILDADATQIAVEFHDCMYAERQFIYSTVKNEVFSFKDGKSTLISMLQSSISSLFSMNSTLIIGTIDGWLSVLSNGKLSTEIEIKTKATCIRSVDINTFVATGENGFLFLFNAISEIVIDKIQIRTNCLNALTVIGSKVHVSGVDSRLTCLSLQKNKLVRLYQNDVHQSDVLTMCCDNNRAISAGEDCSVVFATSLDDKYNFEILYDSSLIAGQTDLYFYIATGNCLDLFSYESSKENKLNFNKTNQLHDFNISEEVLNHINQNQDIYRNILRIKMTDRIIAAAINKTSTFACISTASKTYLYSIGDDFKEIKKCKMFTPAKWIGFNDSFLVLQGLDKLITIYNLSNGDITSFSYKDYEERIQITNSYVYLPLERIAYDIFTKETTDFKLSSLALLASATYKETVAYVSEDEKGPVYFKIKSPTEIETYEIACQVDLSAKNDFSFKNVRFCNFLNDDLVCVNERYLFILNGDKVSTYEIGKLIDNVVIHKDEIVVIQNSYKQLSEAFKPSVFKEKYSNK